MKKIRLFFIAILCLGFSNNSLSAIVKCKDNNGHWFYGDHASPSCGGNKLITLNAEGQQVEETKAIETDEEMNSRLEKERIAREKEEVLEKIQKEKRRILALYENEKDITRLLNNRLESIESSLHGHKMFLESTEKKIETIKQQYDTTQFDVAKERLAKELEEAKDRKESSLKEISIIEKRKLETKEKYAKERELYLKYSQEKNELSN